jgi:hypothetical protein
MAKNIKNYTTEIPAQRTIMEIQNMLIEAGAAGIALETEAGQIKALFFKLKLGEQEMPFKLPARPEKVYHTLFAEKRGNWDKHIVESRKQKALNIAWRIVKDWLEVQLSLIRIDMANPSEVFFPYLLVGANETLYEKAEKTGFSKLLPR